MDELFEKLINDRLSPDELRVLREHFNVTDDDELLTLICERNPSYQSASDISPLVLEDIKEKIDGRIEEDFTYEHKPRHRFLKIAAVVLPLIIIGAGGWFVFDKHRDQSSGLCRLTTDSGETSSLMLSDSTEVKINGNSTLMFPSAFSKKSREITFMGEAYFDVSRNPKSPFTIKTPVMTVTVTGTAFNLLSRGDAKYSELSLDQGSVTVTQNVTGNTVQVTPGTKLILDNVTGQMILNPIDTTYSNSAWTATEIKFENAVPAYLIDRLEQNYNIKLPEDMCKSINANFTGTLPANDLEEALKIVGRIYGCEK